MPKESALKEWLCRDKTGKVVSNIVIFLFLWSKPVVTSYILSHWTPKGQKFTWTECYLTCKVNYHNLIKRLGFILECIVRFLFYSAFISFLRASYSDPGFVENMKFKSPTEILPEKYFKTCGKCGDSWKPQRAHHCKTCKKCVFRMDHHCAWIGNCVGVKNQKFFVLFLAYTMLYSVALIGLCIANLIFWYFDIKNKEVKKKDCVNSNQMVDINTA